VSVWGAVLGVLAFCASAGVPIARKLSPSPPAGNVPERTGAHHLIADALILLGTSSTLLL
jgi:hypothetical protein